MVCDKKIHPKLDEYDLTKFLNCHSTNLITGKLVSLKVVRQIYCFNYLRANTYLKTAMKKIFLFQPSQLEQV